MSWFGKNKQANDIMERLEMNLPVITDWPITFTKCENPLRSMKHRHKINAKKYGRI